MKKLIIAGIAAGTLGTGAAEAATIASQTFDSDQSMGNDFHGTSDYNFQDGIVSTLKSDGVTSGLIDYIGAGLGFRGTGNNNQDGFGYVGTSGGVFEASHMDSASRRVAETGKYGYINASAALSNASRDSSAVLFDTVDLTGHNSASLSLDLSELGTPTDGDDDMLVRVYLNGSSTPTELFNTGGGNGSLAGGSTSNGASFDGTTLTYNFLDTDTSSELYIIIIADDNDGSIPDGYAIDNVVFSGTAIPEPGSLALMAIGGMLLARRRQA